MIKYTNNYLTKIEEMIGESNYILRYEKGQFKPGDCVLKEQRIIVLNKFFSTEGKINALMEILRSLDDFDASGFSEKSRSIWEELNVAEAPAAPQN